MLVGFVFWVFLVWGFGLGFFFRFFLGVVVVVVLKLMFET